MTSQTYSTRSNAKRAAEKALGPHNYTLCQIGAVWTFEPFTWAEASERTAVPDEDVTVAEPAVTPAEPALAEASGTTLDGAEATPVDANTAPKSKQRAGTKQALLIEMLSRPEGATIAEMMEATGWLSHTVRGAMAGALKKRLGFTVESELADKRGRVYRIAT